MTARYFTIVSARLRPVDRMYAGQLTLPRIPYEACPVVKTILQLKQFNTAAVERGGRQGEKIQRNELQTGK